MTQKKETAKLTEIIRFALTGGICFVIEFVALVLLVDLLGMDTLLATPIAFLVSVVVNYLLCLVWVFKGASDSGTAAKVGFLVTSVIGLVLNELLMLLFRVMFGESGVLFALFGFNVTMYMLNKCLSTFIVMVWNYFTKRAVLQSGCVTKLIDKLMHK